MSSLSPLHAACFAYAVMLSPTALASGIAQLRDADLSWQMVPSDEQRAPLLMHEIGTLERDLRDARGSTLKLGLLFQEGALGTGTRSAISDLRWDLRSLTAPENLAKVKLASFNPDPRDRDDLIADFVAFAPDVVVIVGAGSLITEIIEPIERAWTREERAHYVLTEPSKTTDCSISSHACLT